MIQTVIKGGEGAVFISVLGFQLPVLCYKRLQTGEIQVLDEEILGILRDLIDSRVYSAYLVEKEICGFSLVVYARLPESERGLFNDVWVFDAKVGGQL